MLTHDVSLTERTRRLAYRTRGHTHGPITRLMSPGDLGELVKPFVFLDYFQMDRFEGPGMADHPHSGLATHTTLLSGSLDYRDSTGKFGRLHPNSVEWMQAGGGVWHGGAPLRGDAVRGFQLWVSLPPELELAPARSEYVEAAEIEGDGRVRVLLGSWGGMNSRIAAPSAMTYLHVRLNDGETWRYQPSADHDVAWLAVSEGKLQVAGATLEREMAVFEEGRDAITMRAEGPTELVLGSAAKHPHPLVCGNYSVHTSDRTLDEGEAGIRRVAQALGRGGLKAWIASRATSA
jgi:redox-sensitive bicupin YhaK (pirin superfamily)